MSIGSTHEIIILSISYFQTIKKVENTKNFVKSNIENVRSNASSVQTDKFLKTPVLSKTNVARNVIQKSNTFESKFSVHSTNKYQYKSNGSNCDKNNPVSTSCKASNILRASKLGPRVDYLIKRLSISHIQSNGSNNAVFNNNNGFGSSERASTPIKQDLPKRRSEERISSQSKIPKCISLSPLTKSKAPVQMNCRNTLESSGITRRSLSCPNGKETKLLKSNKIININKQTSMEAKENNQMFKKSVKETVVSLKRGEPQTKVIKPSQTHTMKPPIVMQTESKSKLLLPTDQISDGIHKTVVHNHKYSSEKSEPSKEYVSNEIDSKRHVMEKRFSLHDIEPITPGSDDSKPKSTRAFDPFKSIPHVQGIVQKIITTPDEKFNETKSSNDSARENPPSLIHNAAKSTEIEKSTPLTISEDLFVLRKDIPDQKNSEKTVNFIRRNKERLKKMGVKNRRRGSKDKPVKGVKLYKNSIVIDSRYLMIVNRLLEDNRKCLNCKREKGMYLLDKRANLMSRGKSLLKSPPDFLKADLRKGKQTNHIPILSPIQSYQDKF